MSGRRYVEPVRLWTGWSTKWLHVKGVLGMVTLVKAGQKSMGERCVVGLLAWARGFPQARVRWMLLTGYLVAISCSRCEERAAGNKHCKMDRWMNVYMYIHTHISKR